MSNGVVWKTAIVAAGVFLALWAAVLPSQAATPTPTPPAITFPRAREALQGQVRVLGLTDVDGFQKAVLYFGYADDPTHTWFLIAEKHIPTHGGLIARWDTTTIADGNYVLRLVVTAAGRRRWETAVPVRVRNYTPVETPTPLPEMNGTPLPTPTPTLTPTATPRWPTPTPLPPNPAILTEATLGKSLVWGVAAVVVLLAFFGLLRRLG